MRAGRGWWVLLVALTAWSAWLRAPGLDPRSLWQDDQWAGIVARRMTLAEFWSLRPPIPVGFAGGLAVLARLFPDPEWPLQILPAACSVAQIPFIGWTVLRLTGQPALGLLAAALLLVDPLLSNYAVRVKQYSLDSLLTVGLVFLGMRLAESNDLGRKWALVLAAVAAMLFSFPALFVGIALGGAFLLRDLETAWRTRGLPPGALLAPAVFAIGAGLIYATVLHGAVRPILVDYWQARFLPLGDLAGVAVFLKGKGVAFFTGAFPDSLAPLALLVPLGLGVALWRPNTRWLGMATLLLWIELLAAAALRRYPVGGGRTDLFAHGLTLVLVCLALAGALSVFKEPRWGSVVVATIAVALAALLAEPSRYPERRDAALVLKAHALLRPRDGLLLYPSAGLAAGYYWPGEIRVRREERGCGFNAEVVRPGALTLHANRRLSDPETLTRQLAPFLASARPRIVYLGPVAEADERPVAGFVVGSGYEVARVVRAPGAALTLFRRTGLERARP